MRHLRIGLFAAAFALAPALAQAWQIEGMPGDTWGRVTQDLTGETGLGISTFVNQGIDWYKLPGDIMFNTYGEYRYSKRTKDQRYFDADGPAVGLLLARPPFRLGAEYFWERQSQLDSHRGGARRAYLNWYTDWYRYLKRHTGDDAEGFQIQAINGSTWGRVNQDFEGETGTALSGFVNEGIDWFDLPGGITFNTYVEIRFGFRTRDNDYFNAFGPAVGAEFARSPIHVGMDYYWQRYTELHDLDRTWRLYLTWYYNWDVKEPLQRLFARDTQGNPQH